MTGAHAPNMRETPGIQDHLWLCGEFQINLGYTDTPTLFPRGRGRQRDGLAHAGTLLTSLTDFNPQNHELEGGKQLRKVIL